MEWFLWIVLWLVVTIGWIRRIITTMVARSKMPMEWLVPGFLTSMGGGVVLIALAANDYSFVDAMAQGVGVILLGVGTGYLLMSAMSMLLTRRTADRIITFFQAPFSYSRLILKRARKKFS